MLLYILWKLLQWKIIIRDLISFKVENLVIRDLYNMNSLLYIQIFGRCKFGVIQFNNR